jgi:hypothetical protein
MIVPTFQHCVAYIGIKLMDVLMGDGEADAVFAQF